MTVNLGDEGNVRGDMLRQQIRHHEVILATALEVLRKRVVQAQRDLRERGEPPSMVLTDVCAQAAEAGAVLTVLRMLGGRDC